MYGIENYFGFLIAGILLNITPGSDTIYIVTRSISQGRKAGIYSVFGIASGAVIHTLLVGFGLSLVLAKSVLVFTVIKYLGVTYLVYMGVTVLVNRKSLWGSERESLKSINLFTIYRQGLLTDVLNPKVLLFFLSFLPQFVNQDQATGALPFLILGFTFVTTGTIWCLLLALFASKVTTQLRNNEKVGMIIQKITGLIFIALGVKILL